MNGFWKAAFWIVVSALVTGTGTWLMFGRDACGESRVTEKIRAESPYVEDRKLIQDSLRKIPQMDERVRKIETEQTKIGVKLDMVLQEVRGQ